MQRGKRKGQHDSQKAYNKASTLLRHSWFSPGRACLNENKDMSHSCVTYKLWREMTEDKKIHHTNVMQVKILEKGFTRSLSLVRGLSGNASQVRALEGEDKRT